MILYPAVDIQDGKAVRLRQGKKECATIFADDPVEMAEKWRAQGAEWLHIVDLDGAFAGDAKNIKLIRQICSRKDVKIQIGGGIRNMEAAKAYIEAGAARIIIGTMALENPEIFGEICKMFPGKVGVSLDAADGRLKTRGWEKDASCSVEEILPSLAGRGAAFVIYTDITRDGMRSGVNLNALERILRSASLPVICAGGVACIGDIKNLYKKFHSSCLEGIISGRALYEGALNFAEAAAWLKKMGLN